MNHGIRIQTDGHVTTPRGFRAGATSAGIKSYARDALDLGMLVSDHECVAAGTFTKSTVKGAPVVVTQRNLSDNRARAIVVNSGCANVATGERGVADADEMCTRAAALIGCEARDIAVCSTGHIGHFLPMDKIREGLPRVEVKADGGAELARAIMTTDRRPKHLAASFDLDGRTITVGGIAKGSGMIHPDMATMFGFLTTDAPLEPDFCQAVLRRVVDRTFNMISVDADTSTSDTVLLLANGAAGGKAIDASQPAAAAFEAALEVVARHLAREIARDGEGSTKLIEIRVTGAATTEEARIAARAISASPLVKVGVYGNDPNWGRVLAAIGKSGAQIDLARAVVRIGEIATYAEGAPCEPERSLVVAELAGPEVILGADLGVGTGSATAWGCDLTEAYVTVKGVFTT
jgi:glutamate N-acetyltransferase/amino-acid N-acetyltransferase